MSRCNKFLKLHVFILSSPMGKARVEEVPVGKARVEEVPMGKARVEEVL